VWSHSYTCACPVWEWDYLLPSNLYNLKQKKCCTCSHRGYQCLRDWQWATEDEHGRSTHQCTSQKKPVRKEQLWGEVGGWLCGMQWLVFCHCLQVAVQQTQLSVRPSISLGPLPLSDWVARAVGWVSSECWTTVTSAALLGSWPSLFLVASLILSCNKGWVRV